MEKSVRDIINEHSARLDRDVKTFNERSNYSREYVKFKAELSPELSRFERWCHTLGSFVKLKVSEKDEKKIQRQIDIAHLEVEPWQVFTLSLLGFLGVFLIAVLVSVAVIFLNDYDFGKFPFLFFILMVFFGIAIFYFVNGYPERLANKWRLKASSQMVPAILYIVVYMRHTPNLEKAVAFAAEHLQAPLSLDFRKVFYDVEVGKFSSIKESLDHYLETWRDYSTYFIEGFHLIESSLFEPDEARRVSTLEKALSVVLDGVYDQMLKFTHEVRSPLTNVYMLGVVLPTLGLALLPLASAMLQGMIKWYHVFILFNLVVPFLVFFLTNKIMMLRPGGYGETDLLERNRYYSKYVSKKPYFIATLICLPLFILGFLPLIFQFTPVPEWLNLQTDYTLGELGIGFLSEELLFDFVQTDLGVVGPFGLVAIILSFFIPFGIALFFYIVYKMKTKELIVERENTKDLEKEFNNSLFQLGSRIGNGMPPELVFSKVAESAQGLKTEDFFRKVNYNIQQMGMSVENAIFDKRRGAIASYPSDLIATSMRILIESSKKGLKIAARSLMSISEYVKNIQKITMRLRDMLAEIVSDMKSNMTFLAPLLSGVVVGLAAMITSILSKLDLAALASGGDFAGVGGFGELMNIFDKNAMIPTYYLQIAIGLYIIQIIFILTGTLVTVDSGEDKLQRVNKTGKNLAVGVVLYCVVALIATIALSFLAGMVLGGFG